MSDHCIICAEQLGHCAYGQCGHKETCSKCVLRLRTVLNDPRCAYCQQQLAAVFVTRFAGDYTQQVAAGDFDKLQVRSRRHSAASTGLSLPPAHGPPTSLTFVQERADAGELFFLPSAQAYFDDPAHFQDMGALCSFTHPMVAAGSPSGAAPRPFHSLRALRANLEQTQKLHFCAICLEGRKVFVSEQQLYSRAALERHLRAGDEEGPMAESGFKGHPECHFCRKRFFGDNEQFQHMHTAHEQCFLCRRAAPHRYVYYRDYPDLERHFRTEHFLCEQAACLEKKFTVFPTEQELRTHTAREHGQALSRSERRQALTIPLEFSYRRSEQGGGASGSVAAGMAAAAAAAGHGAVVIGGAASAPTRFAQRQQSHGSRGDLAEPQAQQQRQPASRAAGGGDAQVEQAQRDSHAGGSAAAAPSSAAAPQQAPAPSMLRELDFPSVSATNGPGHVVGGRWAGGPAGGSLQDADFPALPGTSKAAKRRANKKKTAAEMLAAGPVRVLNVGEGGRGLTPDNFPVLGAAPAPGAAAARGEGDWQQASQGLRRAPSSQEVRGPPEQSADTAAVGAGRDGGLGSSRARGAAAPPAAEFPTLASAVSRSAGAALTPAPPVAAAGPGAVSEALRAANRHLLDKIKAQLGDEGLVGEFKQRSGAWVRGELSSAQYHDAVAALGLVPLIPELAATCPDAAKRAELLAAHSAAFAGDPPGRRGGKKGTWMPPEAAAAAASYAAQHSSWQCGRCTLANAPAAATCEACGLAQPRAGEAGSQWQQAPAAASSAPQADRFPPLGPGTSHASSSGAAAAAASRGDEGGDGGKGKQKKQSLNQFMQAAHVKTHTQNVWRNPALRGEWASGGAGSLAQQERALNTGWGKK